MIRKLLRGYGAAFSGLSGSVWVLAGVTLVNRSGTMVIPFLSLYLTKEIGQPPTFAGLAMSAYGVGALAGSWCGGWLADRWGTVPVQVLSLLGTGAGFVTLGQMRSPGGIIVTLVLLSTVAEAFRPANAACLSSCTNDEGRVRAFALNRLAINLGMSVGPLVGGALAMVSYRWLFVVDAATCAGAAAILLTWGGPPPAASPPTELLRAPSRSPWRDGPYLTMLILNTLVAALFFQFGVTFPLMMRDALALNEGQIGLLFAVNTVVIVLTEMALTHSLEHRDTLRIVGAGGFFLGLGLAMLTVCGGVGSVVLAVLVLTLGEMLVAPFSAAFAANRGDAASRGRYLGLYTFSYSVAWVVAPVAGTWVYDRLGPAVLWSTCGIIGLFLVISFSILSRHVQRQAQSISIVETA